MIKNLEILQKIVRFYFFHDQTPFPSRELDINLIPRPTHVSNWRTSDAKKKNRSAMRTWGLMLNFIPFRWNAVLKYQAMGVDLLQVKR